LRHARHRGVSVLEMMVALPIVALLLTATMVALNASFKAYADAAEQAATNSATRIVTHRLMTMVRTSTAHGPLVGQTGVTIVGDTLTSPFIELIDQRGDYLRMEYRAASEELWIVMDDGAGGTIEQPMLGGVSNCFFTLRRRLNDDDLYVLERGTMDLSVMPDEDATLQLENGPQVPIRMIASTMPRKVE
jgi:type II secretory pathway pseudopilin PulG